MFSGAAAPSTIGPYRVLKVIGEGGMGVVYHAELPESGEQVALKTVKSPREVDLARMRMEIHALTRIRHDGVIRIVREGVADGLPWYAMELLSGRTMQQYLEELWHLPPEPGSLSTTLRGEPSAPVASGGMNVHSAKLPTVAARPGSLDARGGSLGAVDDAERRGVHTQACAGRLVDALSLVFRLCDPLAFIHGQGIVHRDLKPDNVFIRPDGMPVLMDFGLVSRARGAIGRERLEVSGFMVGTVHYMSPEQIRGEPVDARADLYALGVMLYELVTGRRPFTAPTQNEVLQHHLSTPPTPPSQIVQGVARQLDQLVLGLLEKRPRDRIGHADDVASMLLELGAQPPPLPSPPKDAPPADSPRAYLYRPQLEGRAELIDELCGHLERALRGEGGLVLIAGESGAGKTCLASEVAGQATARSMRTVVGECHPIASTDATGIDLKGAPLHPFRRVLEAVADRCVQLGGQAAARLLGARGKLLAPYHPPLGALVGAEPEPPELSSEEARRRLFEALAGTLAAFAADTPVLLILDDLQWADETTHAFLASLTPEFLRKNRLLLLGTYRVDEANEAIRKLAARPDVGNLKLGRLDEQTVGLIIGGMLAMARPPLSLVQVLAHHADGNPFFVAEYLRSAVAERLLYREGGRWRIAQAGDERSEMYERLSKLPRSLRELVGRRLAGLGEDARALVEAAAAIGREFDGEIVRAVAAVEERAALEAIKELCNRHVFEPLDEGGYRFVHDKLREVAYEQIPVEKRRALHGKAAAEIERAFAGSSDFPRYYSELAHHWKQAESWSKAVEYLERAGEQALRNFSNREAIELFGEALSLNARLTDGVGPIRLARWERSLTEAHLGLGEPEQGLVHAHRTLRHCKTPLPSTKPGWAFGLLWQILRRVVSGIVPLRAVKSQARRALLSESAFVLNRLVEAYMLMNEPVQSTYCGMRNLNLSDRLPPAPPLARGYAFMTIILGVTPMRKLAQAWAARALAIVDKLSSETARIYCLNRVACFSIATARWSEADERLQAGLDLARTVGDRRQLEEGLAIRATGLYIAGRLDESLAAGREFAQLAATRGDPQTQCWARATVVATEVRLGRARDALQFGDDGEAWVEASGGGAEKIQTFGTRALARLQAGDVERARADAEKALAVMRRSPPVPYFLAAAVTGTAETLLTLWERAADRDERTVRPLREAARGACKTLDGFARMQPFARPAALLFRGVEAWLDGKSRRARDLWKRALAAADQLAMPYERARAHLEIGRALDGDERRAHLDQAIAGFDAIGARHDLQRARESLAAR